MDEERKINILAAENRLRQWMQCHKDEVDSVMATSDQWQGVMLTLALDVASSGLSQNDALSSLLALGWLAGKYADDPEFAAILESFPSGAEIAEFWGIMAQERIEEVLLKRAESDGE